jgi:hypothetical protein
MAQMIEHLSSKCKSLNSNPSIRGREGGKEERRKERRKEGRKEGESKE